LVRYLLVAEQNVAAFGPVDDSIARIEDLLANGAGAGIVEVDRTLVAPCDHKPTVGEHTDVRVELIGVRPGVDDKLVPVSRAESVKELAANVAVAIVHCDEAAIVQGGHVGLLL